MNIINIKDNNINGDYMIEKYIIKKVNKQETLYLYLNYNYEFASFTKSKTFFQELKKILNNKFINFKGNKVVLVVSGIIIGTIFLNNINYQKKSINLDNTKYVSQVILNDFNGKDEFVINLDNNIIIDNNEENTENEFINNRINTENNIIKIDNTTEKISLENKINNNESNSDISNDINNNTNEEINNIEENKIIVTIYRSNGEIQNLELEEYLIGVVAGEMPASFNIEALKTQAIIARTYALNSIKNNKILTDTTSTQVYIDKSDMYYKWGKDFNKYYYKTLEAVNSTEGLYITYNGEYIDAVYFANSNGYTEDAYEVWGYDIPYLKSVESSFDINTTRYKSIVFKTYEEISNIIGFIVDNTIDIHDIIRNNSHRISSICINEKQFSGIEFRTLFNLKSTDFEISIMDDGLEITTYGYGHGVGLSQYGANGMANNGYNYEEIIKYYYQNVNIEKNTN